jgi:hypothetical protein
VNETIEFDIQLDVQGDPVLDIYIDNTLYTQPKFSATLEFGKHELRIVHSGKTNKTPEQSVLIKSITVDGINIQDILYTDSTNTPEYPEPWATQQRAEGVVLEETVLGQCELSHNCVWPLDFTSPFYEFVMDHVR